MQVGVIFIPKDLGNRCTIFDRFIKEKFILEELVEVAVDEGGSQHLSVAQKEPPVKLGKWIQVGLIQHEATPEPSHARPPTVTGNEASVACPLMPIVKFPMPPKLLV